MDIRSTPDAPPSGQSPATRTQETCTLNPHTESRQPHLSGRYRVHGTRVETFSMFPSVFPVLLTRLSHHNRESVWYLIHRARESKAEQNVLRNGNLWTENYFRRTAGMVNTQTTHLPECNPYQNQSTWSSPWPDFGWQTLWRGEQHQQGQ